MLSGCFLDAEVLYVQFLEYADSQNRLSDLLHGDAELLLRWRWVKGAASVRVWLQKQKGNI